MTSLFSRRLFRRPGALIGLVITVAYMATALFGRSFVSWNPAFIDLSSARMPPSVGHFLGTDQLGRDMLTLIVVGARISLGASMSAVLGAALIGSSLGLVAGFSGGFLDEMIMRAVDVLLALPGLLLALFIVSVLGSNLPQLVVAVGVLGIPAFARLARGATVTTREREYVQAARALGAGTGRIIGRHILPNILGPIVVQATLGIGAANLILASLGFLGLGAQPPTPEWGLMISSGREYLTSAPHIALVPGVTVMFVVLGVNLLGDNVRDSLDPRLRHRT